VVPAQRDLRIRDMLTHMRRELLGMRAARTCRVLVC
jgi:hypothetical protein